MKAREMTYCPGNIRSAFAATGIWPVNERRVLDREQPETQGPMRKPTSPSRHPIPATPMHGQAILMHGRRTLKVLPRQTPRSKYSYTMVQKLLKAAEKATADNVILTVENENLRLKATSAEDRVKTRSHKELSKAQVVDAEDVVCLREKQEAREWATAERQARAAAKRAGAPSGTMPKTATPSSSHNRRTSNKKPRGARKVVIIDSPISICSGDSEWDRIDSEWEDGNAEVGEEGVEDTIVVQPAARVLRSSAKG